MKLFLATKNSGKVKELKAVLAKEPSLREVEIVSAADKPDIDEPEETGATFAENARLKASYYARETAMTALADDSGLVVDALDGRPGVQSARYGADDMGRITRLLSELVETTDPAERTARFHCAMAVAAPDGRILVESEGRLEGSIASTAQGTHGFGYDPIFQLADYNQRLAEVSPEIKNQISHRGKALAELIPGLMKALQEG